MREEQWLSSEPERGAHRNRRRTVGVDGCDDVGIVDALAVDRGDSEVMWVAR